MSEAAEERAREKERKQPLQVYSDELCITISVGATTLAFAAKNIPNTGWAADAVTIANEEVFLRAVLKELQRESVEDGLTLVHRMVDAAILRAIEQGCEGVSLKGHDA